MSTMQLREKEFRDDIRDLLKKHNAEMIIDEVGESCASVLRIEMSTIYNDDGDEVVSDYLDFEF